MVLGVVAAFISGRSDGPSTVESMAELARVPPYGEGATSFEGEQLVARITAPEPDSELHGIIAWKQLVARGLPDSVSARDQLQFARLFAQESAEIQNVFEVLRQGAVFGDDVSFRGVERRDGIPVARIRWIFADGGATFLDVVFGEVDDVPRILDFFALGNGRWQSDVVAELYLQQIAAAPGRLETMMGATHPFTENAEAIKELGTLVRQELYPQALGVFDGLPADAQEIRAVFVLGLIAAKEAGEGERHLELLDRYVALFPEDPGSRVDLFDVHYDRAEWDEALTQLDAIRTDFDDPYWTTLEARIELQRGNPERALSLARSVMDEDPSLIDGPDVALGAAVELGQIDEARRMFVLLRDQHQAGLEHLATLPDFDGLDELLEESLRPPEGDHPYDGPRSGLSED